MRLGRAGIAVVFLVLVACGDDAGPDVGPGTEEGVAASVDGRVESALGCAGPIAGTDACEFTAPADADGLELWVWMVGDGSVVDITPGTTGGCAVTGSSVCLSVGAVEPGGVVRCEASGAGSWGCALQPGGPAPPPEIVELAEGNATRAAECESEQARYEAEADQRQEAYDAEMRAYQEAMATREPGDPFPPRPLPPVPAPPPPC